LASISSRESVDGYEHSPCEHRFTWNTAISWKNPYYVFSMRGYYDSPIHVCSPRRGFVRRLATLPLLSPFHVKHSLPDEVGDRKMTQWIEWTFHVKHRSTTCAFHVEPRSVSISYDLCSLLPNFL
jgi:hypothetical protein